MYGYLVKVPISVIVLALLIIGTIISGYFYYSTENAKNAGLLGGLAAGLGVAVIQMLMDWSSYNALERLKKLQIKQALVTRDSKEYYGNFIENTKEAIDIMGVSGERFMKDFVDDDLNAPAHSRVIIDLISKGIKIRILMPKITFLADDSVTKAKEASPLFKKIQNKYPNNFNVRYFNHIPAHSIFRVDDECITGPVFTKIVSRFTPAIHFYNSSPIVKKYMEYFEDEWKNADEFYD